MHTSVGLLALAGYLVAPSSAPDSLWMTDYGAAQRRCIQQQKPLAVVIGSGQNGFNRLLKEGNLKTDVRSTLAANYVCLYVDASRSENHRLLKDFDIRSGVGLIVSDRRGEYQVFSHDGPLPESELVRQLHRHALVEAQPIQPAVYYQESYRGVQPSSYSPSFVPSRSMGNC